MSFPAGWCAGQAWPEPGLPRAAGGQAVQDVRTSHPGLRAMSM